MVLDMDAIYTVLVEECAAPDGEWDRPAFVASYEDASWPAEYRFCGALGFGGKFWINDGHLYVTCYREDETPERLSMIARANLRLAKFIAERPDWDVLHDQAVGEADS